MSKKEQELLPSEEREYYQQYFMKIEQLFAALRGRSLLLSPADYQLARQWFDRGIPLSCALRGIRAAFFKKLEEGDPDDEILSLNWCKWAVMKEWKEYKNVPTGEETEEEYSSPEHTGDEVQAILDSARFDLARAADNQEDNVAFAISLRELSKEIESIKDSCKKGELDDESIENKLAIVDDKLIGLALIHLSDSDRAKLEKSVDRKLKPHFAAMGEEARKRTRHAAMNSKVRQHFQLPKITFFSL